MYDHTYNLNRWDSFGCHHNMTIVNKKQINNDLKEYTIKQYITLMFV